MSETAARAYLLWGDDTLSRDEVARNFKQRMLARPGGELNLRQFQAPEVTASQLIATCDTAPFLDDRRLVIVRHLFSWKPPSSARRHGDGSSEARADSSPLKAEREAFLAYLPDLAPQTTLVLLEGSLNPAQRSEISSRLPADRADLRAFPAPQGPDLERWLARRAARHGGQLGPRVASLLREHGPGTLEGLDQEIAKLVTYAGQEPVSTADLDELLRGAEIGIFALLDALAEGRAGAALTALRRLFSQGQRVEQITPQVISLYRRLLICRLAQEDGLSPAEVQRAHGVKIYDKLRAQARRHSTEALEAALEQLLDYDRKLKRSEVDPEAGLELLVAELSARTLEVKHATPNSELRTRL